MTTDAALFDSLKYRIADEFGTRSYYNHAGKLHREEGPAVTYTNGDKSWWLNGYRHRIGGPAVVWHSSVEWWLYGVRYTEEAYHRQLKTLEHTV